MPNRNIKIFLACTIHDSSLLNVIECIATGKTKPSSDMLSAPTKEITLCSCGTAAAKPPETTFTTLIQSTVMKKQA